MLKTMIQICHLITQTTACEVKQYSFLTTDFAF